MIRFKDYFEADVYRHGKYDCTNNGASKRHDVLIVVAKNISYDDVAKFVKEENEKGLEHYETSEFFKVDYEFYSHWNYVRLIPIDREKTRRHSMFGGNYLTCSDSRFKKFVCNCPYPVPIHDRYE